MSQEMSSKVFWCRLGYLVDSQIGLPLLKPTERIVVGAEVLRHRSVAPNGLIEHPKERYTIDHSGMHAEPDDPAGVLIHDDQDPVGARLVDMYLQDTDRVAIDLTRLNETEPLTSPASI
jgi:hypothetical protein